MHDTMFCHCTTILSFNTIRHLFQLFSSSCAICLAESNDEEQPDEEGLSNSIMIHKSAAVDRVMWLLFHCEKVIGSRNITGIPKWFILP